jgi:hypothetical protein
MMEMVAGPLSGYGALALAGAVARVGSGNREQAIGCRGEGAE